MAKKQKDTFHQGQSTQPEIDVTGGFSAGGMGWNGASNSGRTSQRSSNIPAPGGDIWPSDPGSSWPPVSGGQNMPNYSGDNWSSDPGGSWPSAFGGQEAPDLHADISSWRSKKSGSICGAVLLFVFLAAVAVGSFVYMGNKGSGGISLGGIFEDFTLPKLELPEDFPLKDLWDKEETTPAESHIPDLGTLPVEAPTLGEDDSVWQEVFDHCSQLEAEGSYLEAIAYLQEQIQENGEDPSLQERLSYSWSLYEQYVTGYAQAYAQEKDYRRAIQVLSQAQARPDSTLFRDMAADYRLEFCLYNGSLIAAGKGNSVLLHPNGTVTVVGETKNKEEQAASTWSDIIAISAGDYHLVGLRSDGTLMTSGKNTDDQRSVESWNDIIAISAGDTHTVGLRADGTVLATGYNHEGQCNVSVLMDKAGDLRIVSIAAGYCHTIALLEDGTVVATGGNEDGQCNVAGWTDIVAIYAGTRISVGLKADGTVVATGKDTHKWDWESWTDMKNLTCGDYYMVGVREDGTVVAAGTGLTDGQLDVEDWTNVLCVAAGKNHTIALQADGSILAVGSNSDGQCNCEGMILNIGN